MQMEAKDVTHHEQPKEEKNKVINSNILT
uniref:Uncharacterized protein n=1 Tax=Arundo donax TaxID=35708 RepID=A0A0A9ENJ6_ARUDO